MGDSPDGRELSYMNNYTLIGVEISTEADVRIGERSALFATTCLIASAWVSNYDVGWPRAAAAWQAAAVCVWS